jgi:hypothetical protein
MSSQFSFSKLSLATVVAVGVFASLGIATPQSASALTIAPTSGAGGGNNRFLTIQNTGTEEGFNSGAANPDLYADTKSGNGNTSSLKLSEVPLFGAGAGAVRQFILDSAEPQNGTNPSITLDVLKIFLSDNGNLTKNDFNAGAQNFGTLAKLVDTLTSPYTYNSDGGLGQVDQLISVNESLFTTARSGLIADPFVYIYAKFSNAGGSAEAFEVAKVNTAAVPTPALLPGLLGLGAGILRKRKQQETVA